MTLSDKISRQRFLDIATFMRLPYKEDYDGIDIGLVGVPYDGAVTNRAGARHGPRAVRDASSLMRMVNMATGVNPFEGLNIYDIGDVYPDRPFNIEEALDSMTDQFKEIFAAGIIPLACGGDHSVSLPILRAIASHRPVGMVHIDAHCDTSEGHLGSKFHHGAPFKHAVEEGLIDPARCIQIGIRGPLNNPDLWKFSYDAGMRVITMEEFEDMGIEYVKEEIDAVIGDDPTYVTFDVDGLDPVYAPGTGTPEVGGLTTREALSLIRHLNDKNIIGGDVVEVSPPWDPTGNTAMVGATFMYEILCIIANSLRYRRKL
jgi:guanidinopropionase